MPAECAAVAPQTAVLQLHDGDFLAGRLVDCDETGVIRWRMRGASSPFEFSSAVLRAAYFPMPEAAHLPTGDFLIELSNGDLLYGSILSITPERFELETARFGRLRVAREEIRRLARWNGSSPSEYRGPNGLAEWQTAEENQWYEEAGRLITKSARAQVQKKLPIPAKARIELEVAGGRDLEFALVLSSGTSDQQLQQGFRFEVWQRSLVVLRELDDRADMTVVCELDAGENRVQLEALLDQEQGTMSVHAPDGKQLAAIKVPLQDQDKTHRLEWITILNGRGEFRLERLAVGHWNGQLPPQIEGEKAGLCRLDGTIVYGEVVGFDDDTAQFLVRTDDTEDERIDAASVACIFALPAAQPTEKRFRVGLHDGSRLSGELTKVAGDKIYILRRGIEEPLACAVADVHSIVGLGQSSNPPERRSSAGRLELDGVRSHGSLVAASATKGNTCLVWQPRFSETSSPLDRSASGRIVYRDPPRRQATAGPRTLQRRQLELQLRLKQEQVERGGIVQRTVRNLAAAAQRQLTPKPNGAGTLYLRAGDRIPCEATRIDETGVHFSSSVVDATFAPHRAVKALELVSNWTAAALAEEKRQRLLTLPRMQKANPPTHLVASTGGDILRTNLISMNSDTLVVESRLESKTIPRDRVACLIWLHDEGSGTAAAIPGDVSPTVDFSDSLSVQAVRADGVRLTFVPQECTGNELIGASKLLGDCRVEIRKVDVLAFGSMVETLADEQAFHDWKLSDAIEPRYVDADQGGGGEPTSLAGSGLIGKPAPDFRLELLDGGEFQLNEQKGHVVVLDFWASWCGPCMQSMPQVDSIVAKFAAQGVKLLTVNMQEDSTAASSALERLKISPAVALDIDGAVAERFQVTAIPHTVVINPDGNVAQLFIGASPQFAEQLEAAISDLLTPRGTQ
jgi:thiol-disulfide isomerase/thioredoxin